MPASTATRVPATMQSALFADAVYQVEDRSCVNDVSSVGFPHRNVEAWDITPMWRKHSMRSRRFSQWSNVSADRNALSARRAVLTFPLYSMGIEMPGSSLWNQVRVSCRRLRPKRGLLAGSDQHRGGRGHVEALQHVRKRSDAA